MHCGSLFYVFFMHENSNNKDKLAYIEINKWNFY